MTAPLGRAALDDVLGFALTDEQWHVASAPLSPAVVVAGAGSGKTTSMAARVAYLVGSGLVRPDQVLGLTFTTKAAAQLLSAMRRSVAALPPAPAPVGDDRTSADDGSGPGDPTVLTYHAFGARMLAEHGIRLGREPGAPVLADGQREQLAYRLVCRSDLPLGTVGARPTDITDALLRLDDELTELAVDPAELIVFDGELIAHLAGQPTLQKAGTTLLATARRRQVLAALVQAWRRDKADRDVLDFADQIRLAGELVASYPDIVASYRDRFRVVLLDEYQDTSISQRQLLQRAFGSGHPVLAVGDPCQAIYGWRGASVDNIDRFAEHFPTATGRTPVLTLSQNRRSGPSILAVANRTAGALRAVHTGVRPLESGDPGKGRGAVSCALFETYAAELDWLVQEVAATGRPTGGTGPAWSEIAVLAATGADLARADEALRARGIPTRLVGAAALLAQPAVVELRSMLQVVHDPTANPAVVRLLAGPRWRIGPRDLAALGRRARLIAGDNGRGDQPTLAAALDQAVAGADVSELVSLSEALFDLGDADAYSPAAFQRFGRFAAELADLRRHAGEPVSDFLWRVVHRTGLAVEVGLDEPGRAARQQLALQVFADLAAGFTEPDGRLTLGGFLARLVDAERLDVDLPVEMPSPADGVQLLTVHKAKGLEFGYVFVPFVATDAFPGGKARATWITSPSVVPWGLRADTTDALADYPPTDEGPRSVDETAYRAELRGLEDLADRRLAYVAFTRAERGLAVSGHWWGPSQRRRRGPAPFLLDVREACLDGAGTVVHWEPEPAEDAVNPLVDAASAPVAWPVPGDLSRTARHTWAAEAVAAVAAVQPGLPGLAPSTGESAGDRLADWDLVLAGLLEEAHRRTATDRTVRLPSPVSATVLARALHDPVEVATALARPMPQRPAPAARLGSAFHAWVEARSGQQSLLDPDDLPGAADDDLVSLEQLDRLKAAFEAGPFADRAPVAVEAPFTLLVGGRLVTGRIDAVYADGDGFEVVDWKTGSAGHVDPGQLAVYRVAWAQLAGVPVERVGAAFVFVATGEVVRPDTDDLVRQLA